MSPAERAELTATRDRHVRREPFLARMAFFGAAIGFVLAVVWQLAFHLGDTTAPRWPHLALTLLGGLFGLPFDVVRTRKQQRAHQEAAAAKWNPLINAERVETIVATVSAGVRLDDSQANTAWFLQVAADQVLCVWDWADDVTDRVEITMVPGTPSTVLKIDWSGQKLPPLKPKRKFKRGEYQPEQGAILEGTLEKLDRMLASQSKAKGAPARPSSAFDPLANQAERLGFYKYTSADQVADVKGQLENSTSEWFLAAGRAFDADCERLAEGGVGDLLDYLRPALKIEGCDFGTVEESYEPDDGGYVLTIDSKTHVMWSAAEGSHSWELTVQRSAELINQWLATAGSAERIHLLNAGEDGVFVLLTAELLKLISESGNFKKNELPHPLPQ